MPGKLYYSRLAAFCCVLCLAGFAQDEPLSRNIFINQETQQSIDEWNIRYPNTDFHSGFKPYLTSTLKDFHDSVVPWKHYNIKNYFLSKTFNDGPGKRRPCSIQFLPVLDEQAGYDLLSGKTVNELTGGLHTKIDINNHFTIAGTFLAGQVSYPFFTDSSIRQNYYIIPGMGQAYRSGNHYNFTNWSGYASYSPNSVFNFQLGKDKQFIGDGYRSLILSDVASNYPYFRINTNIWHIQYSVFYTWLNDPTNANGIKNNYQNKFSTMHHLSWNATKSFNISFFENVIWQGTDTNRARGYDVNYLNPIVFYRPQEYSVGSPDNAFIGVTMTAKLFKHLKLYGQLALDEFFLKEIKAHKGWWGNKQGWQLGTKYINAFNVQGLTLQVEYNEVRPYTYSHGLVAQNYAHYGQPLAHPLGANFREGLAFLTYRKDRWMFSAEGMYAIIGKDSTGSNVGQNIFLSYTTRPYDYGHYTTQGVKTKLLQSDLKLTFFILPQMNFRAEIGYIQRSVSDDKGYVLQNPY
ncbi:MAG: hypothetical protein ACXVPD_06615, partial [Bacteroidia bacterium]